MMHNVKLRIGAVLTFLNWCNLHLLFAAPFDNQARVFGDGKLQEKMDEASLLIKRDVIFCASLWTS